MIQKKDLSFPCIEPKICQNIELCNKQNSRSGYGRKDFIFPNTLHNENMLVIPNITIKKREDIEEQPNYVQKKYDKQFALDNLIKSKHPRNKKNFIFSSHFHQKYMKLFEGTENNKRKKDSSTACLIYKKFENSVEEIDFSKIL